MLQKCKSTRSRQTVEIITRWPENTEWPQSRYLRSRQLKNLAISGRNVKTSVTLTQQAFTGALALRACTFVPETPPLLQSVEERQGSSTGADQFDDMKV